MHSNKNKDKKSFSPIAIVGMGALFAGSRNLTEFWENIIRKKDCIQEVPPEYFDIHAFYDPDYTIPDKTYCKRGGFLPEIEFDALEFGIPPKALESISLNQLLALKVARDTLLDAGMIGGNPIDYDKEKVGVILGANIGGNAFPLRERLVGIDHLRHVLANSGISEENIEEITCRMKAGYIEWDENSFPGYLPNIVSGRIANRFDFGGVNYTVDAACAGSLCAIKQSIHELHSGNCDIILTGGVNVSSDPLSYLSFSKTPAFSQKNQICPYDKNADGMLVGDGIGMIVLKRLEDAEQAGDKIYAVIKGIGSSSDGRAKSIYAPRMKGQINAIKRAYESSDILPECIGLIEGHGTGTTAGDACEMGGLTAFFGQYNLAPQSIALGSVKSQIGHTTQAAGAASTIKAALALHHKIIPPMINVEEPHPDFQLEKTPFYISTKTRPWISANSHKRHAAASAFGFGGVNFHLILEEYQRENHIPYRINRLPQAVLIDAPSPDQLSSTCKKLLGELKNSTGKETDKILSPYCSHRAPDDHPRLGFVSSEISDTIKKLETAITLLTTTPDKNWNHPSAIFYRLKSIEKNAKIVALFPGQGSQYPDMGNEIAQNYPELRHAFEIMNGVLSEMGFAPVSDRVYQKPLFKPEDDPLNGKSFNQTHTVQPVLAAFCSGLYHILKTLGFQPDVCMGHSFGELTALWASGAVSTVDFYRLSVMRGRVMQAAKGPDNDPGAMLAMKCPPANLDEMVQGYEGVNIANYNSPEQVVISGSTKRIEQLKIKLAKMKVKAVQLGVSGAFHSPYMNDAKDSFKKELNAISFQAPSIPVYSNLTARPYPPHPAIYPEILSDHLQHPVLFQQSIETIYNDGGRVFVEIGPRRILSGFVKDILKDPSVEIVSLNSGPKKDSVHQLWEAITQLKVLGIALKDDVYQLKQNTNDSEEKGKSLKVILKGRQYLTAETKEKMEKAMEKKTEISSNIKNGMKTFAENRSIKEAVQELQTTNSPSIKDLDLIINNHIANSKLQEQFINYQAKQLALIDKLVDQQNDLVETPRNSNEIKEIKEYQAKNIEYICKSSENLYQAHLAYLNNQNAILLKMVDPNAHPIPKQTSPLSLIATNETIPSPPPIESADIVGKEEKGGSVKKETNQSFVQTLLKVVSEKTGYPLEMLDLDMNIEADLGIDSIKRVQIFSCLHESFPDLTAGIELSDLAELSTLQEIVDCFNRNLSASEKEKSAHSGETKVNAADDSFRAALLEIVSKKTGYPLDMLDLDMNIEADLGIDSIKRVEIFSTLHEKFPGLAGNFEFAELAELNTLRSVINFFNQTAFSTIETEKIKKISARYVAQVESIGLPRMLEDLNFPLGHQILITDDGAGTGIHLKQSLSQKGYKTTLIQFKEFMHGKSGEDDVAISLAGLDDHAIKHLLHTITEQNGPIGGFIHINPSLNKTESLKDYFNSTEKRLLKTIFFVAKHLKQPLSATAQSGRRFFFTITRIDGKLGLNQIPSASILQGGYYGLLKSLKVEAPHIFCRAIDIVPDTKPNMKTDEICSMIMAELYDQDSLPIEIGRTAHTKRYTINKKEANIEVNENKIPCPDQDTVFLAPGGGRGVTARCVVGLSQKFQSKFILLGRTSMEEEEPQWAIDCRDEGKLKQVIINNLKKVEEKLTPMKVENQLKKILSRREIQETMKKIEAAGGQAIYICEDITGTQKVKEKLKAATGRFGNITGVIHGAGNLADKLLEKKEETDFDVVYNPKVDGLKTIIECVNLSEIRYMLIFSSISGYFGQAGQTDYSCANEILNKFAHAFGKYSPDALIRSINWGPWEGGMVGPEIKQLYERAGIDLIPMDEGVNFFVDELTNAIKQNFQIIVCPRSIDSVIEKAKGEYIKMNKINISMN